VPKRIVWTLIAVFAFAPGLSAAQTASERLEQLAAEAQERALDLFPVSEIFGRGPGPRQDRLELSLTDEHRERQRAHQRWILGELGRIPATELSPTEQTTHALLAWRARNSLEWLAYPFHQHFAFIHLNPGVAFGLIQLVDAQPFRNEADYRAWFRRVQRYPAFLAGVEAVMREGAAASVTTPRVLVERALTQVEALTPHDVTKSALWKPVLRFPSSIDAVTRTRRRPTTAAFWRTRCFRRFVAWRPSFATTTCRRRAPRTGSGRFPMATGCTASPCAARRPLTSHPTRSTRWA
jgi:uncharacterized protein (DUF885 family)